MKKYNEYKDTDNRWLGSIPRHWGVRQLSQVAHEHFVSNKGIHHQNLLSLSYGRIVRRDINATEGLLPASFDTYQVVEDGNIVLRLTDLQNDQKSLRVGLAREEGIVTSAYVCLGIVGESVIPAYIYYTLHSLDIKKIFYSMGGGLRQNLNWQGLKKIEIPLPPLDEQEKIVSYLESKTLSIDAYVAERERELQLLDELKRSEIANVVTRGLNPTVEMKDSGVPWIGMVPAHWECKQLRNYLRLVSIKGKPEEQLLSVVRELGVIIRDVESKEENHNFIPDDLSGYKYVEAGQFVINKMKAWQGSYAVSEHTGIVSPAYYVCNLNFPNKEFFNLAIRSKFYVPFFTQFSKGIRVGQWDLSTVGLKNIPFFEPPVEEQNEIVEYINNKCKNIDELVCSLEAEIEYLKEYKQSLIAACVTGQINVQSEK